jgi:hypothetical protein
MRRILRENGLSIVLFGLFFVFLIGQFVAGHRAYNEQRRQHGRSPTGFMAYVASGHSVEAVFENWESEFLQMGFGVVMSVFLYQKGSAESKKLDASGQGGSSRTPGPYAPWPVRQGGWALTLYENSLALACGLLFVLSLAMHAVGGMWMYNGEQAEHGARRVSLFGFLGTADFWFQSFQNYQSEFLALGMMAVLSIYFRQEGSPRSKAVDAPIGETGVG